MTGLPFGILMSMFGGLEATDASSAGFLFGILFGFCMAPLMMGVKVVVPFADSQAFLRELNIRMAELAYHPKNQGAEFVLYEAASAGNYKLGPLALTPASFFTVFVQLGEGSASIVGPRQTVNKLHKRFLQVDKSVSARAA